MTKISFVRNIPFYRPKLEVDRSIYDFLEVMKVFSENHILAEMLKYEDDLAADQNQEDEEWRDFIAKFVEFLVLPKNIRGLKFYKHRIFRSVIFTIFSQATIKKFKEDPGSFLKEMGSLKQSIIKAKNLFFTKSNELIRFFENSELRKIVSSQTKTSNEQKELFRIFLENLFKFLRIDEFSGEDSEISKSQLENDKLPELIENYLEGQKDHIEFTEKLSVIFAKNEVRKFNITTIIQPFFLNFMEIINSGKKRFYGIEKISGKVFLLVNQISNDKEFHLINHLNSKLMLQLVSEISNDLEIKKISHEIFEDISCFIKEKSQENYINISKKKLEEEGGVNLFLELGKFFFNLGRLNNLPKMKDDYNKFIQPIGEISQFLQEKIFFDPVFSDIKNLFEMVLVLNPKWKNLIINEKYKEYLEFAVIFSEFLVNFLFEQSEFLQLTSEDKKTNIIFNLVNCPKFYEISNNNNSLLRKTLPILLSNILKCQENLAEEINEKNLQLLCDVILLSAETKHRKFAQEQNLPQFFLEIVKNKKFQQIFLEDSANVKNSLKILVKRCYAASFEPNKINKITNLTFQLLEIVYKLSLVENENQHFLIFMLKMSKNRDFLYLLRKEVVLFKEIIYIFASEHFPQFIENNHAEKISLIFDLIKILGEAKPVHAKNFTLHNFALHIFSHKSFQKILVNNEKLKLFRGGIKFLSDQYHIDIEEDFLDKSLSYLLEIANNRKIYDIQKKNFNLFELFQKLAKDFLTNSEEIKSDLLPFFSSLFSNISKLLENKIDLEQENFLQILRFWPEKPSLKSFSDKEKKVKDFKIFGVNPRSKLVMKIFNKLKPNFTIVFRKKIETAIKAIIENKKKSLNREKFGIFFECSKKIIQDLIINSNKDEYYLLTQVFGGFSQKNSLHQKTEEYFINFFSEKIIDSFFKVGVINSLEKERFKISLRLIKNLIQENGEMNFGIGARMLKILAKQENSQIFSEALLEMINTFAVLWNKFANIEKIEIDQHVQEFYRKLFLKERVFERKFVFYRKNLKNILTNINSEKIKSVMGINAESLFSIEKTVRSLNMTGYIFNQNQNILLLVDHLRMAEINMNRTIIQNVYFKNCIFEGNSLIDAVWEGLKFRNFVFKNIKFGNFKKISDVIFINDQIFCRSKFIKCDFSELKNIETLIFTGAIQFEDCLFTEEQNHFLLLQKNLKFKKCQVKEQLEKLASEEFHNSKKKFFYGYFKEARHYV